MAKDPAVLLYTGDFLIGVADMPFLERGYYITLLCLQHQKGHLSIETICFALGLNSVSEIPKVMEKFDVDEEGKYYQHRMEEETVKRSAYTESRRNNGSKGGRPPKQSVIKNHTQNHIDNHMDNHMGNENRNENEIINSNESDKQKIKDQRHKHGQYGWVLLTEQQYNKLLHDLGEDELERCIKIVDEYAQSTGNKQKYKDWNLVIRKCSRENWKNHKGGENSGTSKGTSSFRPSTGFKRAGE